ncbi:MAG: hypothetical protein LBE11_00340 [Prevotellaceae bacterium]|jgi:nitrogen regulatory protein PII|nr:hypothetical protein [Prevotellaceae bacterium]
MKAIFISYNQALTERIINVLDNNDVRGFTKWALTEGRGTVDGEPHYGSHAWPSMNSSMLTVVEDEKTEKVMNDLRKLDETAKMQGLRAFVWNIEQIM